MDILIPIETYTREFTYKIFLAHLLALRGHTCYVGNKRHISLLINQFQGYMYLDKGFHAGISEALYLNIHSRGGVVVSLDEEGGVDFGDGSTLLNRYSKSLIESSDLVLLWGEEQRRLLKNNNRTISNLVVTGHPRFDLIKPRYDFLYEDAVRRIKKEYPSYILVNTNMSFGNHILGDAFVRKNYSDRFSRLEDMMSVDKRKCEVYIELIKQLATNPNHLIIFRPHPEESEVLYRKAFDELSTVVITKEGSVVPWIIAAKAVVHPDCTTAIECAIKGKKPISFLPKDLDEILVTKIPTQISECFTDVPSLLDYLDRILSYPEHYDYSKENVLHGYFNINENIMSLVADQLSAFQNSQKNRITLFVRLLTWWITTKVKMASIMKLNLAETKLSGFGMVSAKNLRRVLIESDSRFETVQISSISDDLLVLK
ncbi:hypothetical protein OAL14_00390 [Gammaproteobacteria bacterium]|nr:hypothetical protein [Gammaproteobacteria bacterium]